MAHKGDVVIDSEGEGKGSTFTITIPVAGAKKNGNGRSEPIGMDAVRAYGIEKGFIHG